MSDVKFGNKTVRIEGNITVDGKQCDAGQFVGRLLQELEALKRTVPQQGGGSGSTVPTNSSASVGTGTPSIPSSIPSIPSSTSTASTPTPGSLICPECEDEIGSSFYCLPQNCCSNCVDTDECDSCKHSCSCPIFNKPSSHTGNIGILGNPGTPISVSPSPISSVGHVPTATAAQPANSAPAPVLAANKGWDDFGY